MMKIKGTIRTWHRHPECVAGAVKPDNLSSMHTGEGEDAVITVVRGQQLRSVIASVDDYLMNLTVAEDLCGLTLK
ncbi:MAG TPA: KEOPS complex subunit Pcc1 [Methanoregulaceae archaeon]|nr:KEOPS complex subunit Pcc1 [Methanoregulaceae archaeon]